MRAWPCVCALYVRVLAILLLGFCGVDEAHIELLFVCLGGRPWLPRVAFNTVGQWPPMFACNHASFACLSGKLPGISEVCCGLGQCKAQLQPGHQLASRVFAAAELEAERLPPLFSGGGNGRPAQAALRTWDNIANTA